GSSLRDGEKKLLSGRKLPTQAPIVKIDKTTVTATAGSFTITTQPQDLLVNAIGRIRQRLCEGQSGHACVDRLSGQPPRCRHRRPIKAAPIAVASRDDHLRIFSICNWKSSVCVLEKPLIREILPNGHHLEKSVLAGIQFLVHGLASNTWKPSRLISGTQEVDWLSSDGQGRGQQNHYHRSDIHMLPLFGCFRLSYAPQAGNEP